MAKHTTKDQQPFADVLLTMPQAAEVLGVSETWVRCMADRREEPLPAFALPSAVNGGYQSRRKVWLSDLREWTKRVGREGYQPIGQ